MKKMRLHCHEGDCIFLSGGEGGGVGIAVSGRLMAAIPRVSFHAYYSDRFFFLSAPFLPQKVHRHRAVVLGSLQAQTVFFILASLQVCLWWGGCKCKSRPSSTDWEATGGARVRKEVAKRWKVSVMVIFENRLAAKEPCLLKFSYAGFNFDFWACFFSNLMGK